MQIDDFIVYTQIILKGGEMRRDIIKAMMIITLGVFLFTGCSAKKNLVKKGEYIKKSIPHQRTTFRNVWAVADGGGFKVSGKLRLKGTLGNNIPEYVKVDLLDNEGNIVETRKVGYMPRVLTGRPEHREARFSAIFSKMPPPGTTVLLSNVN